ncbi:flavocytochrome c, partial [Colletotrichum cuscutae]
GGQGIPAQQTTSAAGPTPEKADGQKASKPNNPKEFSIPEKEFLASPSFSHCH